MHKLTTLPRGFSAQCGQAHANHSYVFRHKCNLAQAGRGGAQHFCSFFILWQLRHNNIWARLRVQGRHSMPVTMPLPASTKSAGEANWSTLRSCLICVALDANTLCVLRYLLYPIYATCSFVIASAPLSLIILGHVHDGHA